jgi:hypothetical protein
MWSHLIFNFIISHPREVCSLGGVTLEIYKVKCLSLMMMMMMMWSNQPLEPTSKLFWVFEKLQMNHQIIMIANLTDQIRTSSLNLQLQSERSRCHALEIQLTEMLLDQLRRQGFH